MNDKQSNWLDMFRAVNMLYLANQAQIDVVPARTTAFIQHQTNITAIEVKAGLRSTTTTGVTQDKRTLRINLENLTYGIIQQVKAYAISINNNTLLAEMNFEQSYVRGIKDDTLGPWSQQRLNSVNAILPSLIPYGITAAEVAAWQAAISAFIPVISAPRSAQVVISGHVQDLKNLFTTSNAHLDNTVDSLMNVFRASSPSLYYSYAQSREIIDRGHGPATPTTPANPPLTGVVNSGSIVSVFSPATTEYTPTITLRIKNTTTTPAIGPIYIYTANNPGDGYPGYGISLLPGQELEVDITALGGFRPFLNIHNQGPNIQEFEITIL